MYVTCVKPSRVRSSVLLCNFNLDQLRDLKFAAYRSHIICRSSRRHAWTLLKARRKLARAACIVWLYRWPWHKHVVHRLDHSHACRALWCQRQKRFNCFNQSANRCRAMQLPCVRLRIRCWYLFFAQVLQPSRSTCSRCSPSGYILQEVLI
jgi:hypothetical protein